ncbi:MAG: glycosyltransferase [Actinomycetota bacterium]
MRVLFTSSPGRGHIHPMVPLAQALVDRGDDVHWVTGAQECARLERDGFQASAAGLDERQGMAQLFRCFPEAHDVPGPEKADFMFPRLFGTVRAGAMLEGMLPIATAWAPDLLVCEQAEFAGPIVAAALGVPNVCHSFGSMFPVHRVRAAGERAAALWTDHGLQARPNGGCYDHLYIDIYPPSLSSGDRTHLPPTQDLRPGDFATSGDELLPEWVTAGSSAPLVYVTFGTVFSNDAALTAILAALRGLPVSVVVTVGPHGDPAALGPQPTNVHVARYIPQAQLLPHCAAVVSHAGSGTFLAAVAAGLPQLCVPQAADQFTNAAACAQSGTGLALLPGGVTVDAMRAAMERLLGEPSFRERAVAVGQEIAAMSSPATVADRLHREFG